MRLPRLSRGLAVLSSDAEVVGQVEGTCPLDGGGEATFAVVRMRRFGGGRKLLPVAAARFHLGVVQLPFPSIRIDEAPAFQEHRPPYDQIAHARGFWGEQAGDDAGRLGYGRLAAQPA